MTCLAHISDPHFGTEDAPVCAALRASLVAAAPDLVVLSGDITQRARPAQFRAAWDFVASLAPLPVLALPGNHDLPLFDLLTRFTDPYREFRRSFGVERAPQWQGADTVVIGVDSTRVLRHKHGALPPARVADVAQRLVAADAAFRVVALHHPLAVVTASDRRNRLRNADAALAAWTAAGADLFLGGHIHLPYCVGVGREPCRAVLLQAGTAVSTRRRGGQPNSYHLVQLAAGAARAMRIEQRDYDEAIGGFVAARTWQAVRGAVGWVLG